MKRLEEITAALLIILFTYTALHKLANIPAFRDALDHMTFLKSNASIIAYTVPLAELGIVVLLLIPGLRRTGLLGSLALLSVFTLYLGVMVATQSELPCSCGGVISQLSWQQHIAFNMFFIALTIIALNRRSRKPENRVGKIHFHV